MTKCWQNEASRKKTISKASKSGKVLCDSFDKLHKIEEQYAKELAELRTELTSVTQRAFDTVAAGQIKNNMRAKAKIINETKIAEPNEVVGFREIFMQLEKISEK